VPGISASFWVSTCPPATQFDAVAIYTLRMHLNPEVANENAESDWVLGGPYERGNARRWLAYPALQTNGSADGVLLPGRSMLVIELADKRLIVLNLNYQRNCEPLDHGLIDRLAACAMAHLDRNYDGLVEIWRRKGMTHVQFRGLHECFGPKNQRSPEIAWSFALHSDSDPLQALFASPERLHTWIEDRGGKPLPPAAGEVFRHNAAWRVLHKEKKVGAPTVSARVRFIAGLDRWSLKYVVQQKFIRGTTYNYLQGEGCSIKQQRRRQAVERLPILAAAASDPDAGRGGLLIAIDNGVAGSKALAIAYRIPLWVTRRLQGVRAQWLNMLDPERPERHRELRYLLRVLAEIGPDRWPETDGEWEVFREIFDVFLGRLRRAEIDGMAEFDHRVAGALLRELGSSGWRAARRRIERQYGSLHEFDGCMEFFRYLVLLFRSVKGRHERAGVCDQRRPRTPEPGNEQIIVEVLRSTPARLLSAARHWKQAELCEAIARQAAPSKGTPLEFPLRDPLLMRGYLIHPLLDQAAMVMEGLAMHNCVGKLYHQCRVSSQRMFSIRDQTGNRLSTFDLSFNVAGEQDGVDILDIAVNDHRGRANRDPGKEAQEVVNAFVAYLKEKAECLQLREFVMMNADSAHEVLIEVWSLDEGEADAAAAKLRAAALVAREYLSDLLIRL
jgi:hypothetical protein